MDTYVSLTEAASYLGVSKATLRNWDKSGKLRAVRHPINRYRVYLMSELQKLQARLPFDEPSPPVETPPNTDVRTARSAISRMHNVLRDNDANSNIIERFDELTKLLFFKLMLDSGDSLELPSLSDRSYAGQIRALYRDIAERHGDIVPSEFRELKASDSAIRSCMEILSMISFRSSTVDVKGLAYEEVIKNTFDKTDNQQFFTPPTIVQFMVEMMRPHLRGSICDPASGTGGFLVEILKSGQNYNSLTAFEIDPRLAWVSGINLLCHGLKKGEAKCLGSGGSLGVLAQPYFEKFDAILTNPPFGSDFTDTDVLPSYQLGGDRSSRRRGILFLERCHHLLKEGGHLAVIIDEGVLNLPSTEDVRRYITQNFEVSAIVSLPESAFMPYATVNASILFLRKGKFRKGAKYKTFFAKADNIGRKGNGDEDIVYDDSGSARLNSDLPRILQLYSEFSRGDELEESEIAYSADIAGNFAQEENGWRLDFRYHHPSRNLSRAKLASSKNKLMSLSELCSERNKTVIPSTEMPDQTILYTGLANIESGTGKAMQIATPTNSLKSAVKRYEPGDIIFAKMRPNLRKVALMDFPEGGYVSPECVVLSVKHSDGVPHIDPFLLSVLLRSDLIYGQIMHLIAGIGRPRLAKGDLRRVLIPCADPAVQQGAQSKYRADYSAAEKLRRSAHELLQKAAKMERDAVEYLAAELV